MNLESLHQWYEKGEEMEIFGHRIFYRTAGSETAPALLVLHGFPTSCFDFHRVLESLSADRRVILHDHLGFGFSEKPAAASYSLFEQAEVALELWRRLGVEAGHLLAHDYGTSVATEILALRERGGVPVRLEGLTLTNGSIHLELARLRLAQRIARSPRWGPLFGRWIPRAYFKRVIRKLWGDPRRVDEAELEAMWQGIRHLDGHLRTHQISSYLNERVRFQNRWVGALSRFDRPAHILWGDRDPVAVPAIARKLHSECPDSRLTWLEGVGHFPMLEAPEDFAREVLSAPP